MQFVRNRIKIAFSAAMQCWILGQIVWHKGASTKMHKHLIGGISGIVHKQGRKRPLDTAKRMLERRERRRERERKVQGEI